MKRIVVLMSLIACVATPAMANSGRSRALGLQALRQECAEKTGAQLDAAGSHPHGTPEVMKAFRACMGG